MQEALSYEREKIRITIHIQTSLQPPRALYKNLSIPEFQLKMVM